MDLGGRAESGTEAEQFSLSHRTYFKGMVTHDLIRGSLSFSKH